MRLLRGRQFLTDETETDSPSKRSYCTGSSTAVKPRQDLRKEEGGKAAAPATADHPSPLTQAPRRRAQNASTRRSNNANAPPTLPDGSRTITTASMIERHG